MDVIHERCAGINVGKTDVKVCLRGERTSSRRRSEVRVFPTMTPDLLAMKDWLVEQGVTLVGMEATGVYLKPVFYVLESAGKHISGKTGHGDPWLKAVLGQVASAASRSKGTNLAARFKRIASRRGRKRALVAVEHSILVAVWHMFTHDLEYHGLGGDYFLERTGKTRQTRRPVSQLNQLGYQLTLQSAGTARSSSKGRERGSSYQPTGALSPMTVSASSSRPQLTVGH